MVVKLSIWHTGLFLKFWPQKINLSRKTSTRSDSNGGDSDVRDGGGDSAMDLAGGGSSSSRGGDNVGVVQNATELGTAAEIAAEFVKE